MKQQGKILLNCIKFLYGAGLVSILLFVISGCSDTGVPSTGGVILETEFQRSLYNNWPGSDKSWSDEWTLMTLADLEEILLAGVDINKQGADNRPALSLALLTKKTPEIIQKLLDEGARIDIYSSEASGALLPLHYAAANTTYPEIIVALRAKGADPLSTSKDGFDSLYIASEYCSTPDVLKELLKGLLPADVNSFGGPDKVTALHGAAANNIFEIVSLFLDAGADPAVKTTTDATPLHYAAKFTPYPKVITALLEKQADPLAKDNALMTPLHYAAYYNMSPEVMKILTENLSPTDLATGGGIASGVLLGSPLEATILHLAASYNTIEVVSVILNTNIDATGLDTYKNTAIHWTTRNNSDPAILNALIAAGVDINAQNADGNTALHHAAGNPRGLKFVNILLDNSADLLNNNKQSTALHFAAENSDPRILETLITAGADVNAESDEENTALHFAAARSNFIVAQLLITAGADVNAQNADGNTALHYAVQNSDLQLIILLLDNGAVLHANNKGITAWDIIDPTTFQKDSEAYYRLQIMNANS